MLANKLVPFIYSCFVFQLLLDHKADPNLQDLLDKNTALHHACSERHPDCVEALLNAGRIATGITSRAATYIVLVLVD